MQVIYPTNFEQKLGFDKIREMISGLCLSSLGEAHVSDMVFSTQFEVVQSNLDLTNEFREICLMENEFPLGYFIDVTPVLKRLRIEGTYPEPEQLFDIKRSLETIKSILLFFKQTEPEKYPNLKSLTAGVQVYPFVLDRINAIITSQGRIKDNASPTLNDIRKQLSTKQSEVSKRMHQILKKAQSEGWVESDTALSMREGRLVLPISAANKRRIKGIVHDESATGKTAYVEPAEVVELNNDLRELEYQERREIIRILTNFADDIRPYIDDMMASYDFLGTIDFIRAKALFAVKINAGRPALLNQPIINWNEALHPLLFLRLQREKKEVVPLSLFLNETERILIISGPNAGGKSVCLQTVGLIQYMLQCGLLVPMKESSETGIFEQLFIDIGDEQSLDNDLSTYSSHLTNMKFFVRNANPRTIILIDEFGTGTEPMIGGAIAESILEKLNEKGSFGVITTHYTNLKHYATSAQGVVNGAMMFDNHLMKPLFKLVMGSPGSSFAFEIARKIGLPEEILQSATGKVGEEHINFDKHLRDVIRDKRYWEQKRNQIREREKKLEETLERYAKELGDVKEQRKKILTEAKTEAQQILSGVNKQIENTIRQIKEANAEKDKTRELRKELETFKESVLIKGEDAEEESIRRKIDQLRQREERKLNKKQPGAANPSQPVPVVEEDTRIAKGDKVRLSGQDTVGTVMDINGKNILVAFGQLITTVKETRLEKISANEYKKIQRQMVSTPSSKTYDISERKLNFKAQIDLRGMRADEALQQVIEFIDEAIMVQARELKILHGKGNGILRQMIRDYLRTVELIEYFGDEHVQFGGAGITVVKLDV